jgi:hypothetical protein
MFDIKGYINATQDIGMKGILFENLQQVKRELTVFEVGI